MTPESRLAAEIKLYCGEHNYIVIRQQSGIFYTRDGIPVKIGFEGLSDYLIILDSGKIAFVETKIHPRKPTQEQINFIENMKNRGIPASVIYDLDEFKKFIQKL